MDGTSKQTQREEALTLLKAMLDNGTITADDLQAVLAEKGESAKPRRRISFQNVLYIVGGLVFVLGIVLFVAQFWEFMAKPLRVVLTLGLSVVFYGFGYTLLRKEETKVFARVLFVLFVILFPVGVVTFLDFIGVPPRGAAGAAWVSAVVGIPYVISWATLRESLFYHVSVFTGTVLFFAITDLVLQSPSAESYAFRLLIAGGAGMALAQDAKRRDVVAWGLLHFAGLFAALAAAFFFVVEETLFWTFLYPILLAGTFSLAVKLQHRGTLLAGTLFTIIYIGYLTGKYFSDTLGWPLAISLAGVAMMAAGYGSVWLNKTYVRKRRGE